MSGQNIGYIRVSSIDQNPKRQLHDIQLDRIFTEKVSGKTIHRPELDCLLDFIREGDSLFVHSMDRLARNLDDLRHIVQDLTAKNISVTFVNENLAFTNEETPIALLLLSIMGSFAEFERSLIHERQREGIALAKKRGAYKGSKKRLNREQILEIIQRVNSGEKKAPLAREFGISRETLYQYIRSEQ